ncbi:TlpA family protein disulfide reductase [Breznakiella homolactica]|uniref:TlpA family protein disulfide reductase n=1 Tax=Breznakiella homolactica TaxID=2798577 RepID=A0A7T7XKT1_9SPIR|nr:TlpA disulfide reductase family protein [Breznakiella homolactica]QQO08032.1 TlpA family protein disulfide reductase [Breznakiella homolactica]
MNPMKNYRHTVFVLSLGIMLFAAVSCAESKGNSDAAETADPGVTVSGGNFAGDFRKLGMMVFDPPQKIPSFAVTTLEGDTVTLEDFRGRYLFLNFWATWCPPCQAEMPSMERLSARLRDSDFEILAVSVGENAAAVGSFLEKNPYTFPIALNQDGSLGAVYASRGIPTTYIIDRDGNVIAGKIGARSWDDPECIALFEALLETP